MDAGSIKVSTLPNQVDLSWTGVTDDPNGVGVQNYEIHRDGVYIGQTTSAHYTDYTVTPGVQYNYQIQAHDWHANGSAFAGAVVAVPTGTAVDPRRVGIRPTGAYWGGMGEQIDTLSGNLNYSIALLTAVGRQGRNVPIGLSYNSQNWRQDGSTSWKLGEDVGYGFGWRLMAGSLAPVFSQSWLHHFVFTDSTGAEYRLDQQVGAVWHSKESAYVWYDYMTNRLNFKDGSYWILGCISSGVEGDAGTMYPTAIYDSNGNYITINYLPGAGPNHPDGQGWNPPNTSARIDYILDSRNGYNNDHGITAKMYQFSYSAGPDTIVHLSGISNALLTAESYSFQMYSGQALNSPFPGAPACGSSGVNCGAAAFLKAVTRTGVNLTTTFTYDPSGSGELTEVQFPFTAAPADGGHIRWSYDKFAYSTGKTMREVTNRYLRKDVTAAETSHSLTRDSGDGSRPIHKYLKLQDVGATNQTYKPGKYWEFYWDGTSAPAWQIGLLAKQESSNNILSANPGEHSDQFTWSQDAGSNPFVSQTDSYLERGTTNERHSMTQATQDLFGNTTRAQVYDYAAPGNSPALLRTTDITYLHGSNPTCAGNDWCGVYIRNRVQSKTVTPAGGSSITLVTNAYDNYFTPPFNQGLIGDAPKMMQHDPNVGASVTLRGNVTTTVTPGGTVISAYDTEGNVVMTNDSLQHTTRNTVDDYGNVPKTVTPNDNANLATSFSFNAFLGLTDVSNTNGTHASIAYDNYGRPRSSTSPDGAVTYFYYCPDSCNSGLTLPATRNGQNYTKITVVNTRWTRETYDGLGRVIRTERGDTSGNVYSTVDTDYAPCGCSPMGKMSGTSLPYAPGGPVNWTTYTYDGLGRTIAVQAADTHSTTTTAYYGNTTVVADPAGNWKAMSTDGNGNLTSVIEPDPSKYQVTDKPSAPTGVQSPACGTATISADWTTISMPLTGSMALGGVLTNSLGTCYYYDVLNNLVGVDLNRSNYNQLRMFTYKVGTNWLLTATNPENGKVTYERDVLGHVTKRTDAAGQATKYTYDSYNRLTVVNRKDDPCQSESYTYDSPSGGYAWGKLTGWSTGSGTAGPNNACPAASGDGSTWGGVGYAYTYNQAGRITNKRMTIARILQSGAVASYNLDTVWGYDGNEGRPTTMTYPVVNDPEYDVPTSTAFRYNYDTMGRPLSMTPGPNNGYLVSNVLYNANDQVTQMNYGGPDIAEFRGYNSMFQLTSISGSWYAPSTGWQSFSETYTFSGKQNNGQISKVTEGTGESVSYQYDQLKRLATAGSTAGWSQTYTYDGFGNMTARGTDGWFNIQADRVTNRMVGFNYDANGNLNLGINGYSWTYDVENRLAHADGSGGGEYYMYDGSNKRIYKQGSGALTYYLYGLDGKVIGEYGVNWIGTTMQVNRVTESAYFGGNKVLPTAMRDRLGSVRGNASAANRPYGENYSAQNADGFATYYQDATTGLSYADQRYYTASYGRFITPDASRKGIVVGDSQTWNRFAYVSNDPVNFSDPNGLYRGALDEDPGDPDPGCGLDDDPVWCGLPNPADSLPPLRINSFDLWWRTKVDAGQLNTLGIGNAIFLGPNSIRLSPSDDQLAFFSYLEQCGCTTVQFPRLDPTGPFIITASWAAQIWAIFHKIDPIGKPKSGLPVGTVPIDKWGLSKDQIHDIKDGIGAGPADWVGIDKDGNVWTGDRSGNSVEHGPWGDYTHNK